MCHSGCFTYTSLLSSQRIRTGTGAQKRNHFLRAIQSKHWSQDWDHLRAKSCPSPVYSAPWSSSALRFWSGALSCLVQKGCLKVPRRDFPGGQWLRLHAPSEGGLGSNPGLGTRSQMPRIRPSADIINKLKEKKKGLMLAAEILQSVSLPCTLDSDLADGCAARRVLSRSRSEELLCRQGLSHTQNPLR